MNKEEKEFDRWNQKKQKLDTCQNSPHCHEREVWWCSIGVNIGSGQYSQTNDFSRPVLVLRRFTQEIFLGIPLTTKIRNKVPFRFRLRIGDIDNDALILQMRVYDRKRLVRLLAVVPKEIFGKLIETVVSALKTTNPALAGFSGAEANM